MPSQSLTGHRAILVGLLAIAVAVATSVAIDTELRHRSTPHFGKGAVCGASDSQVVGEINRERAVNGVPPLHEDSRLDDFALNWTNQMAASQTLSHNPDGLSGPRRVTNSTGIAGENVDENTSVQGGMEAFYNSPHHKANTLNRTFTAVGAGVVQDSGGNVWITENFVDRNSDHVVVSAPIVPVPSHPAATVPFRPSPSTTPHLGPGLPSTVTSPATTPTTVIFTKQC
jgi:uncharacterized protein YkwD